jgi:MoaA/NifB/PqqE/SkfB family radical SAM enzyme
MINYKNNGFKNKDVDIDLTNKCTLKCSACARQNFSNAKLIPGGDISRESFQKVLNYFDNIYLCGTYGDPIFNPNTIKLLKMCYEQNKFVQIHTAASHKPKKWYEEAFDANLNCVWVFGIDGLPYQSFVYRENQDGEYLFDVMLKAKSKGIKVVWQYLVFGYNESKIPDAKELADKHNIKIEIHHTSRYNEASRLLPPTEDIVKNTDETKAEFQPKCLEDSQHKPPYLAATGQLYPCCWLDDKLIHDPEYEALQNPKLNIRDNTIEEIINSDTWQTFYDNLFTPKCPSYCKKKCTTTLRNSSRIVK